MFGRHEYSDAFSPELEEATGTNSTRLRTKLMPSKPCATRRRGRMMLEYKDVLIMEVRTTSL